jgi:hypothetical protein
VNHARSIDSPSQAVYADIEFLKPGPDRPFSYGHEPPPGAEPPTTEFEAQRVLIRDVRDTRPLSLDANGATLVRAPTAVRHYDDDGELQSRYYPESADLIRDVLGARRVIIFDHNVRRGTRLALRPDRYDQGRPVHHAHTDYTEKSAARRLTEELVAEARALMRRRFVQVNLWRPIREPLRDAPLALCDGATVVAASLRPADLRYPGRCGELYYLAHDPAQQWYYASDMGRDEAWLFKNFDSAPPGPGRVAPHSAFVDPRRHPHVAPRESIEVRAFAFFGA